MEFFLHVILKTQENIKLNKIVNINSLKSNYSQKVLSLRCKPKEATLQSFFRNRVKQLKRQCGNDIAFMHKITSIISVSPSEYD